MKRINIIATIALVLVLLIAATIFISLNRFQANLKPADPDNQTTHEFVIAEGLSLDEIAGQLQDQGLIKDKNSFLLYLRTSSLDKDIQAGLFKISPSMTSQEIAKALTKAKAVDILVIIKPGLHLKELQADLASQGFPEKVSNQILFEPQRYKDHELYQYISNSNSLEGYLAPETFAVTEFNLENGQELIRKSLDQFLDNLNQPGIRQGLEDQGLTIEQAVILTSIVEKEVDDEYRAKVAQVFFKRLELNMPLGADTTFFYAADILGVPVRTDLESPYNTRIHKGLPPGPIGNFELSSLQAVARPSQTDYLFFVSGDNGKTYFNETFEGHLRDKNKYCIELCKL